MEKKVILGERSGFGLVMKLYIAYGFLTYHGFAETSNENKVLTKTWFLKILHKESI